MLTPPDEESQSRAAAILHVDAGHVRRSVMPTGACAEDGDMPLPGMTLGRCQLEEIIGRGSTSIIYRAYHLTLSALVAVKVFRRHSPLDHLSVVEGVVMARLRHHHIVSVIDIGEGEAWDYLVLELLDGRNLAQVLRRPCRLPASTAVSLLAQAAEALAFAARQGVVHGDVKPANLFVGPDRHLKVMDFGLSRFHGAGVGSDQEISASPAYAAPELFQVGTLPSQATDIYAFGVTAFELVTGMLPARGMWRQSSMQRSVLLERNAPGLNTGLADLILACTLETPALRPTWPILVERLLVLEGHLRNIGRDSAQYRAVMHFAKQAWQLWRRPLTGEPRLIPLEDLDPPQHA